MRDEARLERKLREAVIGLGGRCYKLEGTSGLPDRLCVLPGGRVIFVEMKAEGGTPSPKQLFTLEDLKRLGCDARIVKGAFETDCFISELKSEEPTWNAGCTNTRNKP